MSDINVKPTPIQRNSADVAVELTELFFRTNAVENANHVKEIYSEFFATAEYLRLNYRNLKGLVPEEILKLMNN
ncbi:hypothetical protein SLL00_16610 [Metabacillus indicus]|uniref:hypothetical protein n=1 Tax=Metabacillus indicus TaxID=246786 RepID=UPI002A05FA06|nr:hypothetical protein [Metabacillus indicus]MDX8291434.1 hypothetical protein [Metabacillus indicus]